VYCLKVVGTQNSHNVISISTDGKLCSWSLDMLAQPQEILDLQHKQNKAVAATCLAFPQNSVNNFVIGSEEGHVYSGTTLDNFHQYIIIKIYLDNESSFRCIMYSLQTWYQERYFGKF